MQRGAKIALASTIVLSGLIGAALFRKPPAPPGGDRSRLPEAAALRSPADEGGSAKLLGQIDPINDAGLAPPSVPLPESSAAPVTAAGGRRETMPSTWQQAVAAEVREPATETREPPAARLAPSNGAGGQRHKIRDGDTLSSLAREYLGSSKRFMEIYEANRDRLASPDLLPIGSELKIPPADAVREPPEPSAETATPPMAPIPPGTLRRTEAAPPSPVRTYRVKAGDTLATIAKRFYGDSERYPEIYAANREQLKKPADLCEGLLLTIP